MKTAASKKPNNRIYPVALGRYSVAICDCTFHSSKGISKMVTENEGVQKKTNQINNFIILMNIHQVNSLTTRTTTAVFLDLAYSPSAPSGARVGTNTKNGCKGGDST